MTQAIDIKAIIAAWLVAAAIIVLLMSARRYHSVSIPQVQTWQSDTSWTGNWNN